MKQLYADYHDEGLEMVAVTQYYGFVGTKRGLSEEEEYAEMANFRTEKDEPWPMLFCDKSNDEAYGIGLPFWVIIDREGNVEFVQFGYSTESFKVFRKRVATLVGSDK